MVARVPAGPTLMMPVSLALITLGAWWWQTTVRHAQQMEIPSDSWQRVKDSYPLAQELQEPQAVSSKIAEEVVRANPFSPKRRLVPPPVGVEGGTVGQEEATRAIPPIFVYKGHINLGQHQRAIVEDTASHKTHFLEVGQEVTGFKVLDITENRVVLSNLKTHEEVIVSLAVTTSP